MRVPASMPRVLVQLLAEIRHGQVIHGTRQPQEDALHQLLASRLGHGGEPPAGAVQLRRGVVRLGALSAEDIQVEGGLFRQVAAQDPAAVFQLHGQVGPGPVQHRHEVVADPGEALPTEVGQALLVRPPGGTGTLPSGFDAVMHRQALHHRPAQPRRAAALWVPGDPVLVAGDLRLGPEDTAGQVVQSRDDIRGARLTDLPQGYGIPGTGPPPSLAHRRPPGGLWKRRCGHVRPMTGLAILPVQRF